MSLLDAGVPVVIVDILYNWYNKLSYVVRWNGRLSAYFTAGSGVRQGSCLSPAIVNVFMNLFIIRLRCLGVGCCISSIFVGCILYADDILLLSPTVNGLQSMLDKCAEVASILSLEFNVNKSHCIAIGKMCKNEIMPMNLNGNDVNWSDAIKYLGVYLQSDRSVKFDISHNKRNFYAACNSIFLHSHGVNEIALLHLQETYSLSVIYIYIMYAIPALSLTNRQVNELNICWNNVIRRLFGYHKWEIVSALLLSLGRLYVRYLLMLRKVMFYIRLFYSHNAFIHNHFY